jgi:hypothetical protein
MDNAIAHTFLFGQRPGEERFEITVEIGTPYQCGEDPDEWACPVAVRPLYRCLQNAHGGNSFQFLCLAISLAQELLQEFRETGGLLTYEDGEALPLESCSFGVAKGR